MAQPPRSVVVVGSANVDLVCGAPRFCAPGETLIGTSFEQLFGGKGANQAVAASLLGSRVKMVCKTGADSLGEATRDNFARLGVDAAPSTSTPDAATGVALITVDAQGENTIIVVPGANGLLAPADVPEGVFDGAAVLLTQLEVPVATTLAALRRARAAGVTTIFNAAPAPTEKLPDELWGLCDIVCPNESEAEVLTGLPTATEADCLKAARELLRRGAGSVLMTLGARGCLLVPKEGEPVRAAVPARYARKQVVDTTGAGDAFLGALAHLLARGISLEAALAGAVEVASTSVGKRGAQASYPTPADLPEALFGAELADPDEPPPSPFPPVLLLDAAQRAADHAVATFARSGMVLGVGAGRTVDHCLVALARRLDRGELADVVCMPTADATAARLDLLGIPRLPADSDRPVDVALSGCDAVYATHVVKGGKGAMLREKLVRAAARTWVVVCDSLKVNAKFPIPIEVAPAFHQRTLRRLASVTGGEARLRLGAAPAGKPGSPTPKEPGEPHKTDNGNYVVDLYLAEQTYDAAAVAALLSSVPGVVEHGLFLAGDGSDTVVVLGDGEGAALHTLKSLGDA